MFFNMEAGAANRLLVPHGLTNARDKAEEKILLNPDTTFVSSAQVIDHLYVNNRIKVKRYEVISYRQEGGTTAGNITGHSPSDHYAVIIDIEIE